MKAKYLLLFLLIIISTASAQIPTYDLILKNDDLVSTTVYEFDIYMQRTGLTELELATISPIMLFNPAISSGSLVFSIVSGSSELNPSQQPTDISISGNELQILPQTPPSAGNGTIISQSPGMKVGRFRLTSNIPFSNQTANIIWKNSGALPVTKVNAYLISDVNSIITDSTGHLNQLTNSTLSPLVIVSTSPLATSNAGIAYAETLQASGGTEPYSWVMTSGTLPNGVSLSSTGILSGTPTVVGTSTFTAEVTDNDLTTASRSFSITINPGALNNFLVEAQSGGPIMTQTAGSPFNIKITARDSYNNTVTGFTSTTDITSNGILSAGGGTTPAFVAGVLSTRSITVTTSGTGSSLTATRTSGSETGTSNPFTVNPANASRIAIQMQPSASSTAGLPFAPQPTTRLEDAYGNMISTDNSTVVTVSLNNGTGTLLGTLTSTALNGIASFTNLSYRVAETISLAFNATGLSGVTSNDIVVNAASAVKIQVETNQDGTGNIVPSQDIVSTQSVAMYAVTRDSFDNFVANSAGLWSLLTQSGGIVVGDLIPAGDTKSATFTGHVTGAVQIQAVSGTLDSIPSGILTVLAGIETQLAFNQQPTDASAGITITPAVTVQLRDSLGNNVQKSGVLITLSISSGTGTLSGTASRSTDASGLATFSDLSINISGTKFLTASSGSLTSVVSNSFIISASTPTHLVFVQQPADATAGSTISPAVTVQLTDNFGNNVPLAGESITITVASGTDTLQGTRTQLTSGSGLATFNDLSIHLIGVKTLSASGSSYTPATSNSFTISPASPVRVIVETAANGSGSAVVSRSLISGDAINIYAVSRDTFNNFVTNMSATWALENNMGGISGSDLIPYDGNRAATFTAHSAGSATIKATSGGLTPIPTGVITVISGSVKKLAFIQQPSDGIAGTIMIPAVSVQLKDSLDNDVSVSGVQVDIALTTGNGTLSGTLQKSTDATGLATFSDLSIIKTGTKIITASSGILAAAISNSFIISAAAPIKIAYTQQPPSSNAAGTILTSSPTVYILDSFDNNVPLVGDTITIALTSGTGTMNGTLVKLSDATGGVTFDNLIIEKAGIKQLTATSKVYSSVASSTFSITPASAYNIVVETNSDGSGIPVPSQTLTSGNAITAYCITRDIFDNYISSDTAQTWDLQFITDSIKQTDLVPSTGCNCATLTGRLTGTAQIRAQKPGLVSVNSGSITVIPGSASKLAFLQQPTNGIAGAIITPPVTVQVKDLAGNNVTDANQAIALSLWSGTGTMGGTTSRLTNSGGTATFNDLSISLPGGKKLRASHSTYNAAISDTFTLGTYTITATAGLNGTISPSGTINVTHGSNQSFTISPNTGYHIFDVLIDGGSVGATPSYTFSNITVNHTIDASFRLDTLIITATAGENGTISPSGSVKVTYNANQTFTFTPNPGYHVSNFAVDGIIQAAQSSYSFISVITAHTILVNFVPDSLSIASEADPNGIISPSGIVRVGYGNNQTFTITPNTGYHIFDLLVDGSSVGRVSSYTFNNVIINHTISAMFAIDTLTIIATAGSHGTISPSGPIAVTYGSNQSFTITSDTGYHISNIIVDGSTVGVGGSYTFNNVRSNHTIAASFSINTFTITATTGANGSVSPIGPVTANYGSNQSFSIRPNTGYHIDSIKVDGVFVGTDTTYTFIDIKSNHTISATFAPNILTITVRTNPEGRAFIVDGLSYTSTQTFTWTAVESHFISTDTIQAGTTGTRYAWNSWTNAGNLTSIVSPLVNTTFTANFTTQCYLTMNANPGGTVLPLSGWFNQGQSVSISAIADPNYYFNVWSGTGTGNYSGSNNPATVTMNGPITEIGSFRLNPIHITVQTNPPGRSFSYDGTTYTVKQTFTELNPGTQHFLNVLTTQPGSTGIQYVWNYWSDSLPAYHPIQPITDTTFTATFKTQFFLTMTAGTNGTVTPTSNWRDSGSTVTIRGTPNTGYRFKQWAGSGAGSYSGFLDSALITIGGPITQTASFVLDTMTISALAGIHGTISPAGNVKVVYGLSQTFTITPDSIYHVADVVVDGISVGPQTSYTFTNVTTNHTIVASFTLTGYSITATAGTNGTISPSGPVPVEHGLSQLFTITANTGYHIDSVFIDGAFIGTPSSYNFENVTSNHTISVKFVANKLLITATAGDHGTISPNGFVNVNYGSNQGFTFMPDTGYHIDSVFVDDVFHGTLSSYTFINIISDHTIRTVFAINQYTITASAGMNGTLLPNGATIVNYGDSLAVVILADTGYHIVSVIVDGSSVGALDSYTFRNIRANHTISGTFTINSYVIAAAAGTNGIISPSGNISVTYGASQRFSIRPNTNYHVDSVIVDDLFVGSDTLHIFSNITSSHSIRATFTINMVAVTLQTNPESLSVSIDNTLYSTPQQFSWAVGSVHAIAAVDTQNTIQNVRYLYANWSDGGTKRHLVIPTHDTLFTANFQPQYFLSMSANAGGTVTPLSSWQDSARLVTIRAYPSTGYKFDKWQGTGVGSYSDTSNPANIIISSPITETATFKRYPVQIIVQTNPTGLQVIVDDTLYTSPHTFIWTTASNHSIAIVDTQSGTAGTRFIWTSWSDNGVRSHTVVPLNDTTFTALFTTQYYLTMSANVGGTATPTSGWFNRSQVFSITAIPDANYNFTSWSGTGLGSYNGGINPSAVTMNGPITETANFTRKPVQITVSTNPQGRTFTYNGVNYTATQTRTVDPATQQFLGAPSPQPDILPDRQYVWSSWSDSGTQTHSIYPTTDSTFIANFDLQAALTMNSSPTNGGTTNPSGKRYYNIGDTVTLIATPNTGFVFTNWSGAIISTANPASVVITDPLTVTANFGRSVQVQLRTSPSGRHLKVDDSTYTSPKTVSWLRGSSHTIGALSPQSDTTDVRHTWIGWSDGGEQTHVVAPVTDTIFSATFSTQYFLTMVAGTGGTVSPRGGWYEKGRTIQISSAADIDFLFSQWLGVGIGSYSGTNNPAAITLNGAIAETAVFSRILPPPTLAGIPHGETGVSTHPSLSWYAYPGTTFYGVQVSTDSTFTDTTLYIFNRTGITDTSIQLSDLANLKTYYWRVFAKVGGDITRYCSPRRFTTMTATVAVVSPRISWATGFTYNVQWTSTDLSGNVNITVSLDSGKTFRVIKLDLPNGGNTNIMIPDTMAAREIDSCRLRVESYLNNSIFGESDVFSMVPGQLPASVRLSTSVPYSTDPISSTEYKLFSVPGIADTLKVGFYPLGRPKIDWRMFSDNGNLENYLVELSSNSSMQTGEGFWLLKKGNLDIPQFDMVMPALESNATFSIPVHTGWNIIANPFDKTIPWQPVLEVNNLPLVTQLYGYNNSYVPAYSLDPFKGYYFFNGSNLTHLKIPYPFGKVTLMHSTIPVSWKVQLIFESDINRDAENHFGIAPIAKTGMDVLDSRKPPLFLDQGFLYFSRPDWDQQYERFNADFRPLLGDGQMWDFEISNPRKSTGTIKFNGIDQIQGEHRIALINMLNSIPIDLHQQNRYIFTMVSPVMRFKIIVGTNEFVEKEISRLTPETFELVQNFPNPFNSGTSVSVKLPHASNVRIEIYNTLGQQIKVLANGLYPQGIHTFFWDATDYSGLPAATGVYFYRFLENGNLIQTKKMIMIK